MHILLCSPACMVLLILRILIGITNNTFINCTEQICRQNRFTASIIGYCECLFSFKSNNASRSDIFAFENYSINNDMHISRYCSCKFEILKNNSFMSQLNVCGYSTKLQFDLFVKSRYNAVAASLLD